MVPLCYVLFSTLLLWIVLTEGTYLSPRLNRWFYRRGAASYQRKWRGRRYDPYQEPWVSLLSQIRSATRHESSVVLDACCGTGRLAQLMADADWFTGSIVAFDASQPMLDEFDAWRHKNPSPMNIRVIHATVEQFEWDALPSLDVVTLLECSEFLPASSMSIERLSKKLRPGGLLVMTKVPNWLSYFFPGRNQHSAALIRLLQELDFCEIEILPWRWRYQLLSATKEPESSKCA